MLSVKFDILVKRNDQGALPLPNGAHFTEREVDVLTWISRGASNIEIEQQIGIKRGTILNHIKAMKNKTGMPTPGALLLYAVHEKLIGISPSHDSHKYVENFASIFNNSLNDNQRNTIHRISSTGEFAYMQPLLKKMGLQTQEEAILLMNFVNGWPQESPKPRF